MAQEYSIHLRKRMTEFDIIIKNLPYRDGLIIYNRMYLEAMVNYLCLQKFIIGESDAALQTEIDELLERVFNAFANRAEIDLSVALAAAKPISGRSALTLNTEKIEFGEETFEALHNLNNLTTQALRYDLAKSIGEGSSRLLLRTRAASTLKTALERLSLPTEFMAEGSADAEVFAQAQTEAALTAENADLFYLLTVSGETAMNLLFSADFEMWYTLGDAENLFYLTATNNGVQSVKYLSCEDLMRLVFAAAESLEVFIRADAAEWELTPVVAAGLKRYRLLSDCDPLTLSKMDGLTLDELDYVELT